MFKLKIFNKYYPYFIIFFFPISMLIGNAAININIFIILISGLFIIFQKDKVNIYFKQKWFLCAILFWCALILSSTLSNYKMYSFAYSISFLRFIIFSLCIQAIFIEKKLNEDIFIKFLTILLFVVIIDTLIQKFFGKNIFLFESIGDDFNIRLTSFFKDEAVIGSYISKFIFIPLFYLYFSQTAKKILMVNKEYLFYSLLSLSLLAVFFTGERMASLHFLLGLFILFILITIKKKFPIKFFIFSLVILISIFNFNSNTKERFLHSFHEKYGIGNGIMNSPWGSHLRVAHNEFKQNIFLGAGPNTFRKFSCEKENFKSDLRACSTHPHNILAEILSETGIVGLIFLVCFIIIFFKENILGYQYFGILVSLIILFWPIGTSGSFFSTFNGSFIWYILGLNSAFKKIELNH